jgi:hypothetical protein
MSITYVRLVLSVFKQLLGLKFTFHKSKLFGYRKAKECREEYTLLFGCAIEALPFKYLGILMNRFEKKPSNWKGNLGGNTS